MNLKKILFLIVLIAMSHVSQAQEDIHFSQFYENSILRNPALTGVFESDYKVSLYCRNQWSSITDPYQTAQLNAEGKVKLNGGNDFLSFGLSGFYDLAGAIDLKIISLHPAINLNKSLNEMRNTYLSLGFTAGYLQYSFNPSKATFGTQFVGGSFSYLNPSFETFSKTNMGLFDLGAGLNFNTCSGDENQVTYVAGVSAYHLTQSPFSFRQTNDRQRTRWNANLGVIWELNQQTILQIHGNLGMQGTYDELIVGGLIGHRNTAVKNTPESFEIYGGLLYRYADAIIPVVKLKYQNVAIGVSYDVNYSSLRPASEYQGGIELTASVAGFIPARSYYKKTVCPRF